jgi:glutaredoxin
MDIFDPLETGFTIYSKSGCYNCTKVKQLLRDKQIFFLEVDCDEFLIEDKEKFLLFIKERANKEYKIFPMVFYDGKFIGGFVETQSFIDKLLCFVNDDNF